MSEEKMDDRDRLPNEEYQYGFHDDVEGVVAFDKGLSESVVREISRLKNEPEWMLEIRLKAYQSFMDQKMPSWGADLSKVDFDEYIYFLRASDQVERSWDDVPQEIRNTFDRLGIPEAEAKYLSGVATQYDSEVVYASMLQEVESKGVLFFDMDTGLRDYPEIVKQYFGKLVPYNDNKFAALNTAVWSGGSFIYIPKGVTLDKPLQSYFRINAEQMGQFERTMIIVDEGADVHYVEGCTAPIYKKDAMHAAVVEIFVHKNAKCRYTTIQNWSSNVYNLVTKRAQVEAHGMMEWIDGNIGAYITMKYPSCVLIGEYAKGMTISIAVAGANQWQDAGAKMIHKAPNTQSTIISKSVSRNGGTVNYRGIVHHDKNAINAKTKIECDTLILDQLSMSDTMPVNVVDTNASIIEHEARVSKISEEELFYLMSRGLSEEQASETIIMGFLEPFTRELPMEYAVELNQLMKMEMEGSVG
ncbi:Fe-S cluster assembly protein SufB [Erysipelothrix rhusiopathiae]|uniref:Fe-S cluster assembly protein SufB n=1 Tax=Erysipelothrix rhusiopathiae TaxID=1648 RepID=UPI000210B7BC|nr:Fe-S cluster assembly protein SufB [Erysipelothrix rhusiopathiae]AGN23732.1 Fe-S cluster assembly protein SufB [Erysipelothrix rhusiopathiae SY1027]AMS11493.1 Fe-S cluster assembly protein SufB [Erysipelothrix rhusiopathiae]AOO67992.1 Fe-S cluster assembly protein SufB [Erysipelothrix rhusiopathiae]AWU41162.1 Fe-S cluster assembly protein SufB [Erysipelothrix rhusiopathiae]MDE8032940.1 Fe-S cluster assembly protein SufB [Erysipelothrix rhusiopathiae]